MNNSSSQNNLSLNDMASAKVPVLQSFSGETAEDVTTWVTNCKFLLTLYSLDEKTALKAIFNALKGTAFDWARETITQDPSTGVEELLTKLSSRFLSRLKITETAQRFLSDSIPENIENRSSSVTIHQNSIKS